MAKQAANKGGAQVGSGLAAKLGAAGKAAVEAHRNDETTFGGGGDLPSGLEGAVAQLIECKFDLYKEGDNKGKYFFYAAGSCCFPESVNVDATLKVVATGGRPMKTEGLRTSIMEPMCDTKNADGKVTTVKEHIAKVLNYLRQLGVDTSNMGVEDMEAAAAAVLAEAPYFGFRTWIGKATDKYPNPRLNHDWKGVIENYEPGEDSTTNDNSEAADEGTEAATDEGVEAASDEGIDYADLVSDADGGNQDAAAKLTEIATGLGITDEQIADSGESWQGVVDLIEAAQGADGGDDSGTDTEAAADEIGRAHV